MPKFCDSITRLALFSRWTCEQENKVSSLKKYLHIGVNQNLVKDVRQQIDQLRVVMEEKRGKGHAARCPPGRVTITIFLLTFYVTLVCSLCYPSCKALGKLHSSCQILDLSINLLLF